MNNPFKNWDFFKRKDPPKKKEEFQRDVSSISPGRVSVPDDSSFIKVLQAQTDVVTPSFRTDVIQIIRNLYKINPDVSIALQDMFKLTNTGHEVTFPNNTDQEADKMRDHLRIATKRWSMYTAGIDGLVNKMVVQLMVGGAISVEGVPNLELNGLSTILFIKPDDIVFKRNSKDGVYTPYQINKYWGDNKKEHYIKLNVDTYVYAGMYNDTDEPYGIPPLMAALDALKTQQDMKANFKQIMEMVGMAGFLEAKMAKPDQRANESGPAYEARLNNTLRMLKRNLKEGMKEGVVTGYVDDHEFKMNSTSKELGNLNIPWDMNQQSVANGLGINGAIIGTGNSTEASTGVNLSKMISQLKNLQSIVGYVLEFLYSLELQLAGFNNRGITITWGTTTITDDVKVQQARQYHIQNCDLLYKAGIISQSQYAWEMGYDSPDQDEPRISLEDQAGVNQDPQEGTKKQQRTDDKNQSARRSRAKTNPNPSRGDQNSKPV